MPRKTTPPLTKMKGGCGGHGNHGAAMSKGGSGSGNGSAYTHPLSKSSVKLSSSSGGRSILSGMSQGSNTTTVVGLVVVILGLIGLIYYLIALNFRSGGGGGGSSNASNVLVESSASMIPNVLVAPQMGMGGMGTRSSSSHSDPFNDPYAPPLKNDGMYFPPDSSASLHSRGMPMIYPNMNNGGPSTCNSGACAGAANLRVPAGIPINMQTRGYSPDYSQIGILSRERENKTEDTSFRDNVILPLFGRRVMNGRDKYQYYTMSNTGSVNTKLPVKIRGRNCINENGCNELTDNDAVYVDGYNQSFHATIYENSQFSYIPFL